MVILYNNGRDGKILHAYTHMKLDNLKNQEKMK